MNIEREQCSNPLWYTRLRVFNSMLQCCCVVSQLIFYVFEDLNVRLLFCVNVQSILMSNIRQQLIDGFFLEEKKNKKLSEH